MSTKHFLLFTLVSSLLFALTGCTLLDPQPRNLEPEWTMAEFELYEDASPASSQWWRDFQSEELNSLMTTVFTDNLSLQEAYARLKQADASAVKSGAARLPELGVNAGYTRTEQETDLGGETDGRSSSDRYSTGLAVTSWELDLWGRVRAGHKAAELDRASAVEDLRTAYLSVSVETVSRWLERQVKKETLNLLQNQLTTNKKSLELMELRFKYGQSSALDILQQRQSVASVQSLIPGVEADIFSLTNELAVLAGKPPGTDLGLDSQSIPELPSIPDPGIPADVLANRPDVRKAGLALQSADWRLTAAKADRLPAIRLSASYSFSAGELDPLFSNWMGTLAASLTGPIFDAGRRKAEVDRTMAAVDEKLSAYRRTVLEALMEAQNSLIQRSKQAETVVAQTQQLEAARASWRESINRYRNGSIEYLPVLTALTQSQQLERSVLQSHYQLLLEQINLYRVLGGPDFSMYDQIDAPNKNTNQLPGDENE